MNPIAEAAERHALPDPKKDDALYATLVEALYSTPNAVIFGMLMINGIVFSAYFLSADPVILWMAASLALLNAYRAGAHWAYARQGHGRRSRALQRRFEVLALTGAWGTALAVGCFGAYTVIHYPFEAPSILGVAQSMGYLAGISGRNSTRPHITQVQMALVSLPFFIGLVATGEPAYQLIGIAVVFTLLATVSSLQSIHQVFLSRYLTTRNMEYLVNHDALTGLANRHALGNTMRAWQAAGKPFQLISIDLDNFKDANDMFGHPVGDGLLREAAKRIARHFAPSAVVARTGGDEFLIMLPGSELPGTISVANDVINDLTLPFVVQNVRLRSGASIGIAASDAGSAEATMRNADLALYQAKANGKNQVCVYTPDLGTRYEERIHLERDLRRAVERGDLSLAFQPIVNPRTQRATHVEALLRWKHPERGFVSPMTFIPIAETSGLILVIGSWVMQTACLAARSWPKEIGVSVNLSAKQFRRDHDLCAIVEACLRISGLEPRRLTLEITETILIDDQAYVIETLEKIRALGVRTALDDFGTGYSSLGYLSVMPLDVIKLDRSFASSIATSSRSAKLMRGVVGVAQALSLEVIVEGIETADQLKELEAYGIDGVQGYIFARPVDPVTLLPYLAYKIEPAVPPAEDARVGERRRAVG